MEKLPPELHHLIVSHLAEVDSSIEATRRIAGQEYTVSKLASYSTISRNCQSLIESYTFQHINLSSQDLITGKAKRLLTSYRLQLIRTIIVQIDLEPEDIVAVGGSLDESLSSSGGRVFTYTIASLFDLLKSVPDRGNAPKIAVRLEALPPYHIVAAWGRGGMNEREAPLMEEARVRDGLRKVTYLSLASDLESQLAPLPAVSALEIGFDSHIRLLEPYSVCRLAACMGHLDTLEMHLANMGKHSNEHRVRLREGLTEGLSIIPTSVRRFKLEYSADEPMRGWKSDDSISCTQRGSCDALSSALFEFSQRPGLEDLEVRARVDSSIFGSDGSELSDSAWADLKRYRLTLPGTLPSGASLFGQVPSPFDSNKFISSDLVLGAASAGDYVLHNDFQEGPMSPSNIKDLWIASGQAAVRMPSLQKISICVAARGKGRDWNLEYGPEDGLEVVSPPPHCHPGGACLKPWRQLEDKHGKDLRIVLKGPTSNFANHIIN